MVSIIIPALNESGAIGPTVKAVRDLLRGLGHNDGEVVVVDDGSSDNTAEIAEREGAVVVRHLQNLGYGRSLKDGIRAAHHDCIVIIDADGTYPIESIPRLLQEYERGFDMVVGQRQGKYYHESWLKKPLRSILRWIVEFTAGQRIPDINSGLRVFSRDSVLAFSNQLCNTFSFTTSLTLAYLLTGRFVTYVPIDYHERVGKAKVRLLKDSLRTMQYIVQAALYYNPMKIFILMSGMTLLFSAVCFLGSLVFGLFSGFLLGVGSILVAAVIFSLGLLADLIRQVLLRLDTRSFDRGGAAARVSHVDTGLRAVPATKVAND